MNVTENRKAGRRPGSGLFRDLVCMAKIDLPALILSLRPDLRRSFSVDTPNERVRFIAWLIATGSSEYRAVGDDPGFIGPLAGLGYGPRGKLSLLQHLVRSARPDVRAAFRLPSQQELFLEWFYTHGVEELPVWQFLSEAEQRRVMDAPEPWGSRLKDSIERQSPPALRAKPLARRKFGVNLIGYAFGQLGIGEDARMAARALLAAEVPVTMLNYPPGADIPQNDRSMAAHVKQHGDFAFNIFCLTAEENGRFYAERGRAQFQDRYNIGYWPWELGKWPQSWQMMLELVDEVWVSTQHTYDALKPVCTKPLLVMPMAVELGEVAHFASRLQARRHFGLPDKASLFCFSFDLNSYVHRKNPQACVDAFLQAFPRKRFGVDKVGLVIKANKPARANRAWELLKKQAAEDPRIHVIEGTLPRPLILALYKACDCFLSLHRAEGFGRGLAEALQLGLHVICTGYSGNVDFCKPPHADLVRYTLIKVRRNQYTHASGQVWAEPDVVHAATLMRAFIGKPRTRGRAKPWNRFAAQTVGARYRLRLQEIWNGLKFGRP
jgi:glycosyltransferase involved in cell wall biosynthesis